MEMTPYQKIKTATDGLIEVCVSVQCLLYLKGAEAFELLSDFVV